MRSLSLACTVKGGKEIAIIGHSDCQVGKTTITQLIDKMEAVGIQRHLLPENLADFFFGQVEAFPKARDFLVD